MTRYSHRVDTPPPEHYSHVWLATCRADDEGTAFDDRLSLFQPNLRPPCQYGGECRAQHNPMHTAEYQHPALLDPDSVSSRLPLEFAGSSAVTDISDWDENVFPAIRGLPQRCQKLIFAVSYTHLTLPTKRIV
eukprot:TRINITY_DN54847_c0_g1_i1.p1 TRINITY_DN54847_c0_g1~~TRINITY_DN54847_c0_g1_i1.p1  ORF type:complete len:133 (-),score=18.03 TRINITY_DN54847_c0_g1_i1:166-564(-)